ncbi:MAG: hypothetical protein ABIH42_09130 [Planctomycetota bacterium]
MSKKEKEDVVKALPDYKLYIKFSDNTEGTVDLSLPEQQISAIR